jgi:hypothetical protein
LPKTIDEQIELESKEITSEILTDQQIIDFCTKKTDTLELNNVEIEDQVLTLPKIRVLCSSISNLSTIIFRI